MGQPHRQRVKNCIPFVADDLSLALGVSRLLPRLPPLAGAPVHIGRAPGLRGRYGASHAATMLRDRRILFDCAPAEFPRIFVHEVFHFVWLRAGNAARVSFEQLLAGEIEGGVRGELGWSAELRKGKLTAADRRTRTRRWREYCCESFCDTAAWLYSGVERHDEFTLAKRCRKTRSQWFARTLGGGQLPI
jgi:hypothetical protein